MGGGVIFRDRLNGSFNTDGNIAAVLRSARLLSGLVTKSFAV